MPIDHLLLFSACKSSKITARGEPRGWEGGEQNRTIHSDSTYMFLKGEALRGVLGNSLIFMSEVVLMFSLVFARRSCSPCCRSHNTAAVSLRDRSVSFLNDGESFRLGSVVSKLIKLASFWDGGGGVAFLVAASFFLGLKVSSIFWGALEVLVYFCWLFDRVFLSPNLSMSERAPIGKE